MVIGFSDLRCMYRASWFPCVVTFGVPFPLNKVLEGSRTTVTLVAPYLLHSIFFLSINKVRWWSGEVGAMCGSFMIG